MALDKVFIEEMKQKLLEEKSRIEKELERFADPAVGEGNYDTRFEDLGRDQEENAVEAGIYGDNVALEKSLETALKDVNDALHKIESGKYGVCERSGKDIAEDRLRALPWARTCGIEK